MTARFAVVFIYATLLVATATPSIAQTRNPTPAPATPAPPASQAPPARPAPPAAPKHPGQLVNIRTEFIITEQRADTSPTKRTVSIIVGDGEGGSVRSEPEAYQANGLQLNVDVRPELAGNGKIRLNFSLQYSGATQVSVSNETPRGTVVRTNLRESISLVVEDDKPLLVAQSADPNSDRTVTLEVRATILK